LDIQIISESNETLELSIPPYRADVQREIDVIEEILRIYGYNKIKTPEKISFSAVKNEEKNPQRIENAVAQTLISLGFHEAMNNSVVKAEYQSIFSLDENKGVKLINPLSSDLALMRQSMLPSLLENVAYNLNRKNSDLKLFEFGKVYQKANKGYEENYRLAVLISGFKNKENWANPQVKSNFFTLIGVIFQFLNRIGISDIQEKAVSQ